VFLRLGAKVIAFEPQRDCIQELQARLGSHPHLVPINAAVGSSSGQRTFYIERHRTASSLVKDWQGEVVGSVEVPVTTLDDAIAKFGVPQHCKIDVEGYELEVLKGLSRAIPTLSYEYHLRQDGATRALACLDYLSSFGELLVNITPAEKPVFAGAQWWGKNDFIDFFRRAVPQMRGYDYGDIFVKFQKPGCTGLETS
jgi:FkbM family methyltransferase